MLVEGLLADTGMGPLPPSGLDIMVKRAEDHRGWVVGAAESEFKVHDS